MLPRGGGYRSDILIWWDLVEQFGQHGRVADVAAGDLDGPDLQRLLINSDVYLSPDAPLGAAVLARVPLAFTLGLDAGAVDQQVQRARAATVSIKGRVLQGVHGSGIERHSMFAEAFKELLPQCDFIWPKGCLGCERVCPCFKAMDGGASRLLDAIAGIESELHFAAGQIGELVLEGAEGAA